MTFIKEPSEEDLILIHKHISEFHANRTPERIQRNQMLSEQYIAEENMKNLDSNWTYTTKVNIAQHELLGRKGYYRQGASEFQEKLLKVLEEREPGDEPDIITLVKNLKP